MTFSTFRFELLLELDQRGQRDVRELCEEPAECDELPED
jgi:hypothetical protein